MPIIKSAKKKLRQDIKRTEKNKAQKNHLKSAFKKALKAPTEESARTIQTVIDKAAKQNIIHKNKAAHMKSRIAKVYAGSSVSKPIRQVEDTRQGTQGKPDSPTKRKSTKK